MKDMGERPQNRELVTGLTGCSECAGWMKVHEGPGFDRLWYVVVMHPLSNNVDSLSYGHRIQTMTTAASS